MEEGEGLVVEVVAVEAGGRGGAAANGDLLLIHAPSVAREEND